MRGLLILCMLGAALAAAFPTASASVCEADASGADCTAGPQACQYPVVPLAAQGACADCSVQTATPTQGECTAKVCVEGVYAGAGTDGASGGTTCPGLVQDAVVFVWDFVGNPTVVEDCAVGTPLVTAYCVGVAGRCTLGMYALQPIADCEGFP